MKELTMDDTERWVDERLAAWRTPLDPKLNWESKGCQALVAALAPPGRCAPYASLATDHSLSRTIASSSSICSLPAPRSFFVHSNRS